MDRLETVRLYWCWIGGPEIDGCVEISTGVADDGRLTSPALDVIDVFGLMQEEMGKLGLKVKTKDLLAYSPTTQPVASSCAIAATPPFDLA